MSDVATAPSAIRAITAKPPTTLISCEYNSQPYQGQAPGLGWCILVDNLVLGWIVDPSGASPAKPVIIGSLPPPPPPTAPVLSPAWVTVEGDGIKVGDLIHGPTRSFFSFLAMNNGAERKLYANFGNATLRHDFADWAAMPENAQYALAEPPQ
jgi:hypothetical protein